MKFLILYLFTFIHSAYSQVKIVIFTDQADATKAKEVVAYYANNPPFMYLDIKFDIQMKETKDLGCHRDAEVNRLLKCTNASEMFAEYNKQSNQRPADYLFVITSLENPGGSGGGNVAIMTTSSSIETMVHEHLHCLGFADEYEYHGEVEYNRFCKRYADNPDVQVPNLAIIYPTQSSYSSDSIARQNHSNQIPWYDNILPQTLITSGTSLGTPHNEKGNIIGIYPANTCKGWESGFSAKKISLWRSGGANSIMEYSTGDFLPQYQSIAFDRLRAKGARLKPEYIGDNYFNIKKAPIKQNVQIAEKIPEKEIIPTKQPEVQVASAKTKESEILKSAEDFQKSMLGLEKTNAEVALKTKPEVKIVEKGAVDTAEAMRDSILGSQGPNIFIAEKISDKNLDQTTGMMSEQNMTRTPSAETSSKSEVNCINILKDYFNDDENLDEVKKYLDIQGKISLHRLAWNYLKLSEDNTKNLEATIQELLKNRNPKLHQKFIESKGSLTRNQRLSLALIELKKAAKEKFPQENFDDYQLKNSDMKMLDLIIHAEEKYGRSAKSGVMDFFSIITSSYETRLNNKTAGIKHTEMVLNGLESQKAEWVKNLLLVLKQQGCDENNFVGSCAGNLDLSFSEWFEDGLKIQNFIFDQSFPLREDLAESFKWGRYWLRVKK